ncbi:Putative Ribulose kinase [Aspergillus calidoustus]|uniref:Putative Ribulose kinase n=1 Tax=Aspergillus calidoustus TaxID=454130 RepID=A0A0U5GK76_ASPCI|nr:Putative Ribulose kinase [Aspergillus calidoustus]
MQPHQIPRSGSSHRPTYLQIFNLSTRRERSTTRHLSQSLAPCPTTTTHNYAPVQFHSTNASRTMFMNLESLQYDNFLLDFFGIRGRVHLPQIVPSSDASAYGALSTGSLAGVPIMGCLGDQSSALVGQKGFSPSNNASSLVVELLQLYLRFHS